VHERYRQTTDDRQTDGRRHIANMNMSSQTIICIWLYIRAVEMGFENLGFSFLRKKLKNLKIQILDSQSQQKIVAF